MVSYTKPAISIPYQASIDSDRMNKMMKDVGVSESPFLRKSTSFGDYEPRKDIGEKLKQLGVSN